MRWRQVTQGFAGLIILIGAIGERTGDRHAAIGQRRACKLAAALGTEQQPGQAAGQRAATETAECIGGLLHEIAGTPILVHQILADDRRGPGPDRR